jgi:cysteine desulfurase/selenocysteine lyase
VTSIDVPRARADTPACADVIHLNNAGAALPPEIVTDTVLDYLREESRRGGYEAADWAQDRLEGVYRGLARLLGAAPADIAVVDNATRAWQAICYAIPLRPGDRILTCRSEYTSNAIAYLQLARRTGAEVEFVADDEHGQLDVADLRRRLDEKVKLISISHVPTHGGLVNPAEEVGLIAEQAGVPFLLDACQSAGQLDLDVTRLRCDALSGTGRKYLRGPRGTGFLYVRESLRQRLEPAVLDLHSAEWTGPRDYRVRPDARRFETWERNIGAVLGLGAAVEYALDWGLPAVERRVVDLADGLRDRLAAVPGVTVRDRGVRRCGIVTFDVAGRDSEEVKAHLAAAGTNTSVAWSEGAQFDLAGRGLGNLVRASVHYYNTEAELDAVTAQVAALVG